MSRGWNASQIGDQTGRVVVITGATSGIGKETARILADKGAHVVIGARNLVKADLVINQIKTQKPSALVEARELDLTRLASIKDFAESIVQDFEQLDVLINNAGIMACPYGQTEDGYEIQMGTNHLGHFALTGRLMPLLKQTANSRLVVLSSIAHRFGNIDLTDIHWQNRAYNTNRAYGDSKLANLYFMNELVRKLADDKDAPMVVAAHPGWTKTELQRHVKLVDFLNIFFAQDAEQGAMPTLRAGFDPDVTAGDFYGPSRFFELRGAPKKVKGNKLSQDADIAKALWQQSEQLTGVSY